MFHTYVLAYVFLGGTVGIIIFFYFDTEIMYFTIIRNGIELYTLICIGNGKVRHDAIREIQMKSYV